MLANISFCPTFHINQSLLSATGEGDQWYDHGILYHYSTKETTFRPIRAQEKCERQTDTYVDGYRSQLNGSPAPVLIHMLILLAQSEHLAIVRLTVEIMRYKQPVVPRAQCYCQYYVPPVVGETLSS